MGDRPGRPQGAASFAYTARHDPVQGTETKRKRKRRTDYRWRPYRVECTGSLPTSEITRRRARLVLGWGTAREDLRVLPAFRIAKLKGKQQQHTNSVPATDVETAFLLATGVRRTTSEVSTVGAPEPLDNANPRAHKHAHNYSLRGSNPRPMAHKTIALTTELREPTSCSTTRK